MRDNIATIVRLFFAIVLLAGLSDCTRSVIFAADPISAAQDSLLPILLILLFVFGSSSMLLRYGLPLMGAFIGFAFFYYLFGKGALMFAGLLAGGYAGHLISKILLDDSTEDYDGDSSSITPSTDHEKLSISNADDIRNQEHANTTHDDIELNHKEPAISASQVTARGPEITKSKQQNIHVGPAPHMKDLLNVGRKTTRKSHAVSREQNNTNPPASPTKPANPVIYENKNGEIIKKCAYCGRSDGLVFGNHYVYCMRCMKYSVT